MDSVQDCNVNLATLPTGSATELTCHVGPELFADLGAEVAGCDVSARVTLEPSHGAFKLAMALRGVMQVPCDRCLEPVAIPVDTRYELTLRLGPEYDDAAPGILVIPERDPAVDLAPLMRDTLILALPMRRVHPDGACDAKMASLLASISTDPEGTEDD